jgi:hypothetical protein
LTVERREPIELEPGEEVLALARASFRGSAATSVRATFALGSARMRLRAFHGWHDAAITSGFPHVPPDMYLAATGRRILFGKPTFWGRPPAQFSSAIDLSSIAQIAVTRHGLITGVAFGMTHGAIVEVEALRGRGLRRLVEVVAGLLTHN